MNPLDLFNQVKELIEKKDLAAAREKRFGCRKNLCRRK